MNEIDFVIRSDADVGDLADWLAATVRIVLYARRLDSSGGREAFKMSGDVRSKVLILSQRSERSIWIGSIWESPGMESKVRRVIALARNPLLHQISVVVWIVAQIHAGNTP